MKAFFLLAALMFTFAVNAQDEPPVGVSVHDQRNLGVLFIVTAYNHTDHTVCVSPHVDSRENVYSNRDNDPNHGAQENNGVPKMVEVRAGATDINVAIFNKNDLNRPAQLRMSSTYNNEPCPAESDPVR